MRVAVTTEVKQQEYRVAVTPAGVHELVRAGHQVVVQEGAGLGSSITDDQYRAAGASMAATAEEVWAAGELVVKVKEPVASEYGLLGPDQVLFTYLHLAASKACTDALLAAGTTSFAYETVRRPDGSLPLLAPMSEIAGRLATVVGSYHLMRPEGGRGVLVGGVPGVRPGRVVVIGAGTAGSNAAEMALGLHAEVSVLDTNLTNLRRLEEHHHGRCRTLASTVHQVEEAVRAADLVIGAVLVPGARAPRLVSSELVADLRPGTVFVDISIDQGGCFEDSRPTTHADPTYEVHGAVFYCVANMPGAVPRTATYALANATLPFVAALAGHGWREAARQDPVLAGGLTTHAGGLVNAEVAAAHGYEVAAPPVG